MRSRSLPGRAAVCCHHKPVRARMERGEPQAGRGRLGQARTECGSAVLTYGEAGIARRMARPGAIKSSYGRATTRRAGTQRTDKRRSDTRHAVYGEADIRQPGNDEAGRDAGNGRDSARHAGRATSRRTELECAAETRQRRDQRGAGLREAHPVLELDEPREGAQEERPRDRACRDGASIPQGCAQRGEGAPT